MENNLSEIWIWEKQHGLLASPQRRELKRDLWKDFLSDPHIGNFFVPVQGPSASAYVTYYRSEDALRAIQAVNNIFIDGRTLKASLGTTKYCSHFMKNQSCPKNDCMYLHELGKLREIVIDRDEGNHPWDMWILLSKVAGRWCNVLPLLVSWNKKVATTKIVLEMILSFLICNFFHQRWNLSNLT